MLEPRENGAYRVVLGRALRRQGERNKAVANSAKADSGHGNFVERARRELSLLEGGVQEDCMN